MQKEGGGEELPSDGSRVRRKWEGCLSIEGVEEAARRENGAGCLPRGERGETIRCCLRERHSPSQPPPARHSDATRVDRRESWRPLRFPRAPRRVRREGTSVRIHPDARSLLEATQQQTDPVWLERSRRRGRGASSFASLRSWSGRERVEDLMHSPVPVAFRAQRTPCRGTSVSAQPDKRSLLEATHLKTDLEWLTRRRKRMRGSSCFASLRSCSADGREEDCKTHEFPRVVHDDPRSASAR